MTKQIPYRINKTPKRHPKSSGNIVRVIGLAVTNPTTGDRAIVTGFKSRIQAERFGRFRAYCSETVRCPKVVIDPDLDKYKYHFTVDQDQLMNEVIDFFKINMEDIL